MSDELTAPAEGGAKSSLIKSLLLYTLARLVMFAAVTAVIYYLPRLADVQVPLLVAMAFGLLVSLPISMFAFKTLRLAVNADIARVDANRRADREDLESKLRGDSA